MGWGLFLHVAAALQPAVASTGCGLGSSLDQPGCIHAPVTVRQSRGFAGSPTTTKGAQYFGSANLDHVGVGSAG